MKNSKKVILLILSIGFFLSNFAYAKENPSGLTIDPVVIRSVSTSVT
jgi:hypothetical protein